MRLHLIVGLLWALGAATPVPADEAKPGAERRVGGDLFAAGPTINIAQPVAGDLMVFGGSLDVDAPVSGDLVGAGGRVRIGSDIGGSVYAAGGQLTLHGKVGRSLRAAGGQLELSPKAEVAGNVTVAGGQVRLLGAVRGHVQSAGGRLRIDGPIGGDVLATSGQLELGPNARIAGKLRHHSGEPLQRDPSAQVAGGVEQLMPTFGGDGERSRSDVPARHRSSAIAAGVSWAWTLGLIVLAAALVALLPGWTARMAASLRQRPAAAIGLGFVVLVCTPVAAVLCFVTLIGIPLGMLLLASYVALLPVAYVSAAIGLGDHGLARWQPQRAAVVGWRILAAAVVLVALALLAWIPMLGWLIGLAALLAGIGAWLLSLRRSGVAAAGA